MPLTIGSGTVLRMNSPTGMPKSVENTNQPALPKWTCRQSCATTTAATVMEMSTATGAATSTGRTSASSGTAIRASPNPNAERITVARKNTAGTCAVAQAIANASLATIAGVRRERPLPENVRKIHYQPRINTDEHG